MKTGHWFCTTCDDVVHLPATAENPLCPVCHHRTLQWIGTDDSKPKPKPVQTPPPKAADAALAIQGFALMRQVVASADPPP
jgi:hypothetical protein